ncbi:MAG: hypothetical protein LBT88_06710 [Oscillospiraceae bacterium]|jgi:hypothetical protein|nr:hypothetical protein [Oscillospiraceae bacterium]
MSRNTLLWIILPVTGIVAFIVWLFWPIETRGDPNILNVRPIPSAEPFEDAALEGLVKLTPQNVQDVIASISRPESYLRTYEVILYWNDGSRTETVSVTLSETTLTVNDEQIDIAGKTVSEIDLLSRIPAYESVLDVSVDEIRSADYVTLDGVPYIRVRFNGLMYVHEYFISIESGLLEHALKRLPSGETVYQMILVR